MNLVLFYFILIFYFLLLFLVFISIFFTWIQAKECDVIKVTHVMIT